MNVQSDMILHQKKFDGDDHIYIDSTNLLKKKIGSAAHDTLYG